MRQVYFTALITLSIFLANCKKNNDTPVNENKNRTIIVDKTLYETAANDAFDFTDVEIIDDSLHVTFSYGGGCGDIEVKLIDSESIMESMPVQRNIRLSLKDNDDCKMQKIGVFSFDLKPIRINDDNEVLLNIAGWDTQLLYEY